MKRLFQVSLIAALALSSIPMSSNAGPRFYRETIYYNYEYFHTPGHGLQPGERVEVGWVRYYCDGTIRSFGQETGEFEDFEFGTCD